MFNTVMADMEALEGVLQESPSEPIQEHRLRQPVSCGVEHFNVLAVELRRHDNRLCVETNVCV